MSAAQLSLAGHAAREQAARAAPVLPLRDYQEAALDAIAQAEARGVSRPLVALPTGTGKTVCFAHLIHRRPGRALVLAHRDELIQQGAEKLRMIAPALEIGVVKAERDEHAADVVVASVQTLARPSRLARLELDFTTVVVDEAHHAAADTYIGILERLGSLGEDGPLTVGFTATPERADDRKLGAIWEEIVYQRDILEMIAERHLCDLRGQMVGTDADLAKLHVRHGELVDSEVAEELVSSGALQQVAGAYVKYAHDRKGLAFTPTVETAHLLAGELAARGIPAEALDGTTPTEDRRAILQRLHTGETQVVANCAVLTEGFDEPSVSCILIARPTRSRPLYVQMVGRGTRQHLESGKADCLVLDLAGVTMRHDLTTVASLVGLNPEELEGRTLTEALAAKQAREKEEEASGTGEGAVQEIRLPGMTLKVAMFRSRMRWLQVGAEYMLPCDVGAAVHLVPDGETWRVEGRRRGQSAKTLARGLSLEYAQGVGENVAQRFRGGALARADASWRDRPPSRKQLAALKKWRIKVPQGAQLTAGQVADMISTAAANAAARRAARGVKL